LKKARTAFFNILLDGEYACGEEMRLNLKEILKPGARAAVVGLGRSGVSAVDFLQGLGVTVLVSEGGRREELDKDLVRRLEEKGVALETGGHTSEFLSQAKLILASPGVPLDLPPLAAVRAKGIPVLGELALAPEYLKPPVAAVTGTNGKSTVTTLIGHFLAGDRQVFLGGNIGTPLTDYLAGHQDRAVAVLEVSSFQLDSAGEFRPQVGALINISPDHLDRYPSYRAYAASKMSLFKNQGREDTAIINGDDPVIASWLEEETGSPEGWPFAGRLWRYHSCGRRDGAAWLSGTRVVFAGLGENGEEEYELAGTTLAQAPNSENAMVAIMAARALACPPEVIRQGLRSFQPLPHRLTLVAEVDGVAYYDDSKATNVGAVYSALAGMHRPVVLIAGGRGKGGGYESLIPLIKEKVRAAILIGEEKEALAEAFAGLTRTIMAGDLPEAVRLAKGAASKGDAVLLSPACASFDMFKSYSHRGEVFSEEVRRLKEEEGP